VFSYGANGYGFGLRQNGIACRLFLTKVDVSDVTSGGLEIADLNWHHVAVTKSNDAVIFYVDGVAAAAPAYNPGFSFSTSAAVGSRGDSIYATLDEVGLFNRVLSPAEIQAIVAAAARAMQDPGLAHYCPWARGQ
jgi:sialidase-1